jgi:sugar transferase (PEP-CTERM/EpsH1 system associated)
MKVLFLTHRVPYAPNRGDRIRAYHVLQQLKAAGFSVCLVSLAHDGHEAAEARRLAGVVDSVHVIRVARASRLAAATIAVAGDRPLTHALLDSPEMIPLLARVRREFEPEVVLAYCSGMARFAMQPPLAGLPFVLDMVDVDSFKWGELAAGSRGPRRWLYARESDALRRFEAQATRTAAATVVVSPREAEALRRIDPAFSPLVVPVGVDVTGFLNRQPPAAAPNVVFTGVFSYAPNLDGALWLIEEVWPLVRMRCPTARLTLVGSGPGRALRRRAARAGVEVTGAVADVRPYLWSAAVAVAPLQTARGVQNKVVEATAAALPSVVTPAVYEGLPESVRPACIVAGDARLFAAAIADLLALSPAERRARANRAVLDELRWERALAPLRQILISAAGGGHASDSRHALAGAAV